VSRVAPRGNVWVLGLFVHGDIDDSDLSVYEFRVYARLCRRAGDELRVWEGQKKIAEGCKMSRGAVQKALYGLRDKGWIELHEVMRDDGSQGPNDIVLRGPPASEKGTPPPFRKAPPASEKGTLSNSIEVNPIEVPKTIPAVAGRAGKNAKTRTPNPIFDSIVLSLYPQGVGSNSAHIGKVASSLSGAGWTAGQVAAVITWRKRDPWWAKKITLGAFEKNCEDWKRESGQAVKTESGAGRAAGQEDITEGLF
jgi:hypothetical protein